MEDDYKPVNVRVPLDMYDALRAMSLEQHRSLSGQVLFFIKQGLKPRPVALSKEGLPFE